MRIAGIVAEYNPLHNGHVYHLHQTRSLTGADYVIVVMSPDFVQRGEAAVVDKYVRTKMALSAGADLVLELPVCYATGSAEYFAYGAVSVLHGLQCVTHLSFGCETETPEAFSAAARILAEEPEAFRRALFSNVKQGLPFPAAREKALLAYASSLSTPDEMQQLIASIVSQPNNILALEYQKALTRLHSSIIPVPVLRRGSSYHDLHLCGGFASAAAIRSLIASAPSFDPDHPEPLNSVMPPDALSLFSGAIQSGAVPDPAHYSRLLHYALLQANDLSAFQDMTPSLANRIEHALPDYRDAEQFAMLVKTKNLTLSRVRRSLLHLYLGMLQADADPFQNPAVRPDGGDEAGACGYARILGFRKSSTPLLHIVKKASAIPLITKPADAPSLLNDPYLASFQQDIRASHLWQLLHTADVENEYRRSPILL